MRNWVSGWSTAQRAVVVVAWAGVLLAGWDWAQRMGGWPFADDGGWFNYAPNAGVAFSGPGPTLLLNPGLRLAVQLALVAGWAVPSFWLLSVTPRVAGDDRPEG
jgi:hypothetical protein